MHASRGEARERQDSERQATRARKFFELVQLHGFNLLIDSICSYGSEHFAVGYNEWL
jgi:hypothetical protein